MNKELFSVANATFSVTANYNFSEQLRTPKAYNIHHNFILNKVTDDPVRTFAISLEDADVDPEIRIDTNGLSVRGRLATERGSEVERQSFS